MERIVHKYRSFKEVAPSDLCFDRSLTAQQKLDLLFDLIHQGQTQSSKASEGFKRVYLFL